MIPNGHRYLLLDVFSATPFAGNPLAVFPDAAGLDTARMQAIANELNLSETVFVGHPTGENRFPIRIFTPSGELPFAGHPTLGSAQALAALGRVDRSRPLILEAGVGELAVCFTGERASFTASRPVETGPSTLTHSGAAELLGLPAAAVIATPVVASCGLPFHLVALDNLDSLARARPFAASWAQHVAPSGVEQLYLYVEGADDALRSRMFSTELGGLREDPATGSAAAALAGWLTGARHGRGPWQWRILQGVEMGRPSTILAEAERDAEDRPRIRIGGEAVIVGEGRFYASAPATATRLRWPQDEPARWASMLQGPGPAKTR